MAIILNLLTIAYYLCVSCPRGSKLVRKTITIEDLFTIPMHKVLMVAFMQPEAT